jgi:hypothetical protein
MSKFRILTVRPKCFKEKKADQGAHRATQSTFHHFIKNL